MSENSPVIKLKAKERGQGLVEFALILPLFLLLVWGIIEFGRLLVMYTEVSNAAREAVGDERNPYWMVRRIARYIQERMTYELAGGWNIAPTSNSLSLPRAVPSTHPHPPASLSRR